jgi:arginyl-tRNA synthetase
MKNALKTIILAAATAAYENGIFPSSDFSEVILEEPKADSHGDLSTNMAMQMAKTQRMPPRKIAEALIDHLDDTTRVSSREPKSPDPGFINFFIRSSAWFPVLAAVHEQGGQYGRCNLGNGARIQIEFVSSNPTGPLACGPRQWRGRGRQHR